MRSDASGVRNRAVTDPFEPGSTAKEPPGIDRTGLRHRRSALGGRGCRNPEAEQGGLMDVAADTVRDVSRLRSGAEQSGKRLLTFTTEALDIAAANGVVVSGLITEQQQGTESVVEPPGGGQ